MDRRTFLSSAALAGLGLAAQSNAQQEKTAQPKPQPPPPPSPEDLKNAPGVHPSSFAFDEVAAFDLRDKIKSGELTSERITELYLQRIEDVDSHGPALRSLIEINPDALEVARALDAELKTKGPRGPLHGLPVLIKDNIDTADKM
ncbi:MAG: hypothetical protein JO033_23075, partial [Acidobacteriaceae bacterium]|nr:hypothetical protein [Acidobacteriaceae bacterium]